MGPHGHRSWRAMRRALVGVAAVISLAACSPALPAPLGGGAGDWLHHQANAALARWADAVNRANADGLAIVGELTGQAGDWEGAVGENNKPALQAGLVQPGANLSAESPPPGEVRWADGTAKTVDVVSAAQALDDVVRSAGGTCPECLPIEITSAAPTTGPVQTSRGPATAPIWEFTVKGTRVRVTRVAVANRVSVVPPPWDPNNSPEGISVESARGRAHESQLTVRFVGVPDTANRPCGADYTAEAVESELAVVVIVIEHRNPALVGCRLLGADRTATVALASPLDDRAVLEVREGLPVPVLAP